MKRPHLHTKSGNIFIGKHDAVDKNGEVFTRAFEKLEQENRRGHMYCIGMSGTGKSALQENMIAQDLLYNQGLAVIDPNGRLIQSLLDKHIPRYRLNDIVYFNPSDTSRPCGLNMLEGFKDFERARATSEFVSIFKSIWGDSWGPSLEFILKATLMSVLEKAETTLLDVYRMLVDKNFRDKIVSTTGDPIIKSFWTHILNIWTSDQWSKSSASVLNKVADLLMSPILRNVLCQKYSTIDIEKIMEEKKILLVDLSRSTLGEDNSKLLGSIVMTKFYLAALKRKTRGGASDFYLYVDDFQHFSHTPFSNILSHTKGSNLNLMLANQSLRQLEPSLQENVVGNVDNLCVFRVGQDDAEILAKVLDLKPDDLTSQHNYNVTLKQTKQGGRVKPITASTLPPLSWVRRKAKPEDVIQRSREVYTRDKKVIEESIKAAFSSVS